MPTCQVCKKHLRRKHIVGVIQYPDMDGYVNVYICSCGSQLGVFLYNDESKNVDYVVKKV
jgi:hypothetical protein